MNRRHALTGETSRTLTRCQFLRQSLLIADGALLSPAPVLAIAAVGEAHNLAGPLGIEVMSHPFQGCGLIQMA